MAVGSSEVAEMHRVVDTRNIKLRSNRKKIK